MKGWRSMKSLRALGLSAALLLVANTTTSADDEVKTQVNDIFNQASALLDMEGDDAIGMVLSVAVTSLNDLGDEALPYALQIAVDQNLTRHQSISSVATLALADAFSEEALYKEWLKVVQSNDPRVQKSKEVLDTALLHRITDHHSETKITGMAYRSLGAKSAAEKYSALELLSSSISGFLSNGMLARSSEKELFDAVRPFLSDADMNAYTNAALIFAFFGGDSEMKELLAILDNAQLSDERRALIPYALVIRGDHQSPKELVRRVNPENAQALPEAIIVNCIKSLESCLVLPGYGDTGDAEFDAMVVELRSLFQDLYRRDGSYRVKAAALKALMSEYLITKEIFDALKEQMGKEIQDEALPMGYRQKVQEAAISGIMALAAQQLKNQGQLQIEIPLQAPEAPGQN